MWISGVREMRGMIGMIEMREMGWVEGLEGWRIEGIEKDVTAHS